MSGYNLERKLNPLVVEGTRRIETFSSRVGVDLGTIIDKGIARRLEQFSQVTWKLAFEPSLNNSSGGNLRRAVSKVHFGMWLELRERGQGENADKIMKETEAMKRRPLALPS